MGQIMEQITEKLNMEEIEAEKAKEQIGRYDYIIAHMISDLQGIYDPDRFVIGGGISRQPLLLKYIQKNLDYFYTQFKWPGQKADVATCKFFNDANLIGAYSYYLSRFGE